MTHARYWLQLTAEGRALWQAIRRVAALSVPELAIGIGLLLLGCVLNVWAERLFRRHDVGVCPFTRVPVLVERRPVPRDAQPDVLGLVALNLSASFLTGVLPNVWSSVAFALWLHYAFVLPEEAYLRREQGAAFAESRPACAALAPPSASDPRRRGAAASPRAAAVRSAVDSLLFARDGDEPRRGGPVVAPVEIAEQAHVAKPGLVQQLAQLAARVESSARPGRPGRSRPESRATRS